jgi:proline dehydrogenase
MSAWQSTMIYLACNQTVRNVMQGQPLTRQLAGRFVGGRDARSAVTRAVQLKRRGFAASLYYLGEYVTADELIEANVAQVILAAEALAGTELDLHISVDPTQIGYARSAALGERNMRRLAELVVQLPYHGRRIIMLDMEDFSYVQTTIDLHARFAQAGFPVAITIQAYLHRSPADIDSLVGRGATVRLVKGAFCEKKERSWTSKADISRAYLRLAHQLLSSEARERGVFPIFATHDEALIRKITGMVRASGWEAGSYEFEMLYGVRPDLQRTLAEEGHSVRLYLPFGTEWWPYAARRIGERPANALFVLRAMRTALGGR